MNIPITDLSPFSHRLVTLCDGRPGLRGGIHIDAREPAPSTLDPRPASPVLDFIASSEALDRYDEIILASGWRLDNYRRNPVFQNAHQYGDIIFTLGKALLTEVRDGKLFQRVEFATDVNPMARIAHGLYKGKFLNAVSVGFIPICWVDGDVPEPSGSESLSLPSGAPASPSPIKIQKSKFKNPAPFRRKYLEHELLEVSAVGIPANPEALQLGIKSGVIETSDLRALLDSLRGLFDSDAFPVPQPSTLNPQPFRSSPAGSAADTSALGAGAYEAQLLHLARALRDILKRD